MERLTGSFLTIIFLSPLRRVTRSEGHSWGAVSWECRGRRKNDCQARLFQERFGILQAPSRKELRLIWKPASATTSPSTQWWRTRWVRARQNAQTWLWKKGVSGTSVPDWSPSLLRGTPWMERQEVTTPWANTILLHIRSRPTETFLSKTFLYSVQTWEGGVAAVGRGREGFLYIFVSL